MRFIERFSDNHYASILSSLVSRFGTEELSRVNRCLQIHSKKVEASYSDSRQRPKFFYFPDLPATPYFQRQQFPWIENLEAATNRICTELQQVLCDDARLEPFLALSPLADVKEYVLGDKGAAGWEAYFFYRHGEPNVENMSRCPDTSAVIESLPSVKIKGNAPEILFSVLAAGTEIAPHRGVTNTRTVVHLPLLVPPDCALHVGGEIHSWEKGRAVMFDDTYEHGAWNRSGSPRAVLIFDVWNPFLTEIERHAIAELVPELALLSATVGSVEPI